MFKTFSLLTLSLLLSVSITTHLANAYSFYEEMSEYDKCIFEAEVLYDQEIRNAQTEKEKQSAKERLSVRKWGCMKLYL